MLSKMKIAILGAGCLAAGMGHAGPRAQSTAGPDTGWRQVDGNAAHTRFNPESHVGPQVQEAWRVADSGIFEVFPAAGRLYENFHVEPGPFEIRARDIQSGAERWSYGVPVQSVSLDACKVDPNGNVLLYAGVTGSGGVHSVLCLRDAGIQPVVVWSAALPGFLYSDMTLSRGRLFLVERDLPVLPASYRLRILDAANGATLSDVPLPGAGGWGQPSVDARRGRVYLKSALSVLALDLSGNLLWSAASPPGSGMGTMVDEGGDRILCFSDPNLVHGLSGSTGQLLWTSQTASGSVLASGRRALLPGRLVSSESYPLGRNDLFALDLATGARIWTAPSAQDGDLGSNNFHVAGTAAGLLWVRTQHGFACHAASDGQKLSDVFIGAGERGFGEVVPTNDGLFYVGSHLVRLVP